MLLDSISKRYSACGARVGCLVTRNEELLDAALRLGQARLCPPTMEQLAAMAALDTPDEYMDEMVDAYRRRRDVVFEALPRIEGVRCRKPTGAFYAFVELPVDDADEFARWLLADFKDGGETVMLAPGAGFYGTPGLGRREARIAFVLNEQAMARSMEILERALTVYPNRRI